MTRKDFIATAAVIKSAIDKADSSKDITGFFVATEIAAGMAEVFAAENPRFVRERFMAACGI